MKRRSEHLTPELQEVDRLIREAASTPSARLYLRQLLEGHLGAAAGPSGMRVRLGHLLHRLLYAFRARIRTTGMGLERLLETWSTIISLTMSFAGIAICCSLMIASVPGAADRMLLTKLIVSLLGGILVFVTALARPSVLWSFLWLMLWPWLLLVRALRDGRASPSGAGQESTIH